MFTLPHGRGMITRAATGFVPSNPQGWSIGKTVQGAFVALLNLQLSELEDSLCSQSEVDDCVHE